MSNGLNRELTTLEYMVLGLISMEPRSGYGIISAFETDVHRWSASPGSIYPILKRLEKQDLLDSQLEMVHETRPRKMYSLTPLAEEVLNDWLRRPPTKREVSVERDIVLRKFLFAENRLSHQEILAWLDDYEQGTDDYEVMLNLGVEAGIAEGTVHYQLFTEAARLELEMQRNWIQMARHRLKSLADEATA